MKPWMRSDICGDAAKALAPFWSSSHDHRLRGDSFGRILVKPALPHRLVYVPETDHKGKANGIDPSDDCFLLSDGVSLVRAAMDDDCKQRFNELYQAPDGCTARAHRIPEGVPVKIDFDICLKYNTRDLEKHIRLIVKELTVPGIGQDEGIVRERLTPIHDYPEFKSLAKQLSDYGQKAIVLPLLNSSASAVGHENSDRGFATQAPAQEFATRVPAQRTTIQQNINGTITMGSGHRMTSGVKRPNPEEFAVQPRHFKQHRSERVVMTAKSANSIDDLMALKGPVAPRKPKVDDASNPKDPTHNAHLPPSTQLPLSNSASPKNSSTATSGHAEEPQPTAREEDPDVTALEPSSTAPALSQPSPRSNGQNQAQVPSAKKKERVLSADDLWASAQLKKRDFIIAPAQHKLLQAGTWLPSPPGQTQTIINVPIADLEAFTTSIDKPSQSKQPRRPLLPESRTVTMTLKKAETQKIISEFQAESPGSDSCSCSGTPVSDIEWSPSPSPPIPQRQAPMDSEDEDSRASAVPSRTRAVRMARDEQPANLHTPQHSDDEVPSTRQGTDGTPLRSPRVLPRTAQAPAAKVAMQGNVNGGSSSVDTDQEAPSKSDHDASNMTDISSQVATPERTYRTVAETGDYHCKSCNKWYKSEQALRYHQNISKASRGVCGLKVPSHPVPLRGADEHKSPANKIDEGHGRATHTIQNQDEMISKKHSSPLQNLRFTPASTGTNFIDLDDGSSCASDDESDIETAAPNALNSHALIKVLETSVFENYQYTRGVAKPPDIVHVKETPLGQAPSYQSHIAYSGKDDTVIPGTYDIEKNSSNERDYPDTAKYSGSRAIEVNDLGFKKTTDQLEQGQQASRKRRLHVAPVTSFKLPDAFEEIEDPALAQKAWKKEFVRNEELARLKEQQDVGRTSLQSSPSTAGNVDEPSSPEHSEKEDGVSRGDPVTQEAGPTAPGIEVHRGLERVPKAAIPVQADITVAETAENFEQAFWDGNPRIFLSSPDSNDVSRRNDSLKGLMSSQRTEVQRIKQAFLRESMPSSPKDLTASHDDEMALEGAQPSSPETPTSIVLEQQVPEGALHSSPRTTIHNGHLERSVETTEPTFFEKFRKAHPQYTGTEEHFTSIIKKIVKHWSPHFTLWDAYVVCHQTKYLPYASSCLEEGRDITEIEPYEVFFNSTDAPQYPVLVLNRTNIGEVCTVSLPMSRESSSRSSFHLPSLAAATTVQRSLAPVKQQAPDHQISYVPQFHVSEGHPGRKSSTPNGRSLPWESKSASMSDLARTIDPISRPQAPAPNTSSPAPQSRPKAPASTSHSPVPVHTSWAPTAVKKQARGPLSEMPVSSKRVSSRAAPASSPADRTVLFKSPSRKATGVEVAKTPASTAPVPGGSAVRKTPAKGWSKLVGNPFKNFSKK